MKSVRNFLVYFLLIISTVSADKTCEKISEYIFKNLPEYGVLKQDSYGFVYVDVDDRYIQNLITFLEDEGYEKPPYFGRGLHGAHISVIYVNEADYYSIDKIEEAGTTINFKVKGCKIVSPPSKPNELDYLVIVEAPVLNKIRKKYGLAKPLYDFHITIGKKNIAEEKISSAH